VEELMSMRDLVVKARSIRRYDESKPVSKEDLLSLVDIARLAPCGGNQQRLRYRLVTGQQECDDIFQFIKWAASLEDWAGPSEGERPTGYIAILCEGGPAHDVGIVGGIIQLAAAEKGLGTCMLGAIDREGIAYRLSIPEELSVKLLIAVGVPGENVVLEDSSEGDDLVYYRTEDGVHHVPKLGLDDVIVE
jgi:nitroreductase